jgi:LacI family transcriptional regulator
MAGVSLGTVSHVLNNSAIVSEPLRGRVLEVVELLGYQPSQLARGLRRDKTDIIGMIIPDITNPFFPAVVRGAEDAAFGSGYRLVLCNTDNSESKEIAYMNELRTYLPAGIVVIPSNISEMTMKTYDSIKGGAALVCLDRLPRHWKGDTVTFANEEGASQATNHLINLGHTRVATVTGPIHITSAHARLTGFRRALKRAGINVPTDYVQESNFDREGGYEAGRRLLELADRPTAIFAQNDLMAMGVLMAMRQMNLSCPEDISIIGFDGLDVMEMMDPPLSSVMQPGYQLGSVGVQLLLERVSDPSRKFRHQILPTELRLRDSTAAPAVSSKRRTAKSTKRPGLRS